MQNKTKYVVAAKVIDSGSKPMTISVDVECDGDRALVFARQSSGQLHPFALANPERRIEVPTPRGFVPEHDRMVELLKKDGWTVVED